jgi:hypothetical protein
MREGEAAVRVVSSVAGRALSFPSGGAVRGRLLI